MKDGAFGLSTGLFYVPGHVHADRGSHRSSRRSPAGTAASTCRISATTRRRCSTACKETIAHRRRRRTLPTQITHHKIDRRRRTGARASRRCGSWTRRAPAAWTSTIDQYPYTASSTSIVGGAPAGVGARRRPRRSAGAPEAIRRRARGSRPTIVAMIRDERGGGDPKNVQFVELRLRPVAGRQDARRPHAPARPRADARERRRGDALDRRAGRLPGHLPRDERGRSRAHPAAPGDDDRVGRRGADLRPRRIRIRAATARSRACSASTCARSTCSRSRTRCAR